MCADIGKTFGPLPDWRTGNHLENIRFTGPPTLLQDLIFFQNKSPHRGAPNKIFFTGQEDRHSNGFQQSSAVFTGRGPRTGEFPNVCVWLSTTCHFLACWWHNQWRLSDTQPSVVHRRSIHRRQLFFFKSNRLPHFSSDHGIFDVHNNVGQKSVELEFWSFASVFFMNF